MDSRTPDAHDRRLVRVLAVGAKAAVDAFAAAQDVTPTVYPTMAVAGRDRRPPRVGDVCSTFRSWGTTSVVWPDATDGAA